jgi:hypothetical protein
MNAPCLPGLFSPVIDPMTAKPMRVRKNVRAVSKETYNVLADTGMLGAACTKVMRSLKFYINQHQECPTPAELTRHMYRAGVINRDSTNLVSPRLTELAVGKVKRQKDGSPVRVGGREVDYLPVRLCRVTGNLAHPVRPRQKGSVEPR